MAGIAPPTDGELRILNVLWELGPATVRSVHERLEQQHPVGYTTVLKLLQIMLDKELVVRRDQRRPHVYSAVPTRASVQGGLVSRLADKAFGGSGAQLVMRALSDKPAEPEELAEIRALLDRLEQER